MVSAGVNGIVPRFRHRHPGLWLAVLLSVLPCQAVYGASPRAGSIEEYDAKAALAFSFARYTDWPESALVASPKRLRFCVVGDAAVAEAFQAVHGRRVGERHVRVAFLRRQDNPANCDLLFIDSRDRPRVAHLLSGVRDLPVLTVAELPGFVDYGGIINLYRSGDRFRFEVSLKAAKRARLTISSRLLRLARIIE